MLFHETVTAASPPDIDAPTELKKIADGSVLLRLLPALDVTVSNYFLIVVADEVARKKNPADIRIDEVSYSIVHIRSYLSVRTCIY